MTSYDQRSSTYGTGKNQKKTINGKKSSLTVAMSSLEKLERFARVNYFYFHLKIVYIDLEAIIIFFLSLEMIEMFITFKTVV